MAEITLAAQIKAVESVINVRKKTHASSSAFLRQAFSGSLVDQVEEAKMRDDAALEAALATLKTMASRAAACLGDCDHTDADHVAFDAGVLDGEKGEDDEACPYRARCLREAWLAGHSIGELNKEYSDEPTANNRA